MASSINNSAWLQWMAGLMGGESRQTHAATFPPDRFYCLLDELPLHLIPQQALRAMRLRDKDHSDPPLFMNPECLVCRAGELPAELAHREADFTGFSLQGTMVWVPDPVSGSLLPFWLGPRFEAALRDLRGEPVPVALDSEVSKLLVEAGILISAGHRAPRMQDWDAQVMSAAPEFREKGYAPMGQLIHPFHLGALRRYYRYLIRTGVVRLGDGQSPRRYVSYNDPVARFFHRVLAHKLSQVAGQPLKPSYVYLASYLSGADLKKHTDRAQCEFSLTLCLDFSPEPALQTHWPIKLSTPEGTVAVYQALGDALAYRGTRLPHYRDVLPEGQTSTSIFFHYVPADFTGSLD
jgi:hypothetical protein